MAGEFFVHPMVDAGVARVELGGDVDTYTSPEVQRVLEEVARDGVAKVVVDLSAVDFIDSSGLSALIAGSKQARRHGVPFGIVGPNRNARRLFEIAGLNELLGVEAD